MNHRTIALTSILGFAAALAGQDRLGPELGGVQYDIPVDDSHGNTETVTCVPDAGNVRHFYYFPTRLRLATQTLNGRGEVPIFTFLKFNVDARDRVETGGILNFAVSMALPQKMLDKLEQELAKRTANGGKVTVGMVPLSRATVTAMVQRGGDAANDGALTSILGSGDAPLHPGGVMPFTIHLTPTGSAIYEDLVKGAAGVFLACSFDYSGLTRNIDCKVTGTWDKIYKHYSSDKRANGSIGGFLFGGSFTGRWQEVRDNLTENRDVKIVWNPKPDETTDVGKRLVQLVEGDILMRIFDAVMNQPKPQMEAQAAEAAVGSRRGLFGGVNYGVAVKDVERRRTGSIGFTYSGRSRITARDVVNGAVQVGNLSKELKDLMFREVTRDAFFNTVQVVCCPVLPPPKLGVQSVRFTATQSGAPTEEVVFLRQSDGSFQPTAPKTTFEFSTPRGNGVPRCEAAITYGEFGEVVKGQITLPAAGAIAVNLGELDRLGLQLVAVNCEACWSGANDDPVEISGEVTRGIGDKAHRVQFVALRTRADSHVQLFLTPKVEGPVTCELTARHRTERRKARQALDVSPLQFRFYPEDFR
jgi:hypothetical protein